MRTPPARGKFVAATAVGLLSTALLAAPVGADEYRTSGSGKHFYTSWTEYDADDALGLPGNVHIGYLSGWSDQYGTYFYGNVTDFDCDEGESPWGGHGIVETIAEEGAKTAEASAQDAVDAIVDSGASVIDANEVIEAVQERLSEAVPAAIAEEIEEEIPTCDYIQDRFLDGTDTVTFTVDIRAQVVQVSGTLTVAGGGHGEPSEVLGTPPINLTITGGEWQKYESSYSYWGQGYRYSYWSEGTDYYGGTVSGAIGAMGFDDEPDDEAYGGFGTFRYKTVEKIR